MFLRDFHSFKASQHRMSQFWDRSFPLTNTFLGRRFTAIGINTWLSVNCGRAGSGAAIA
jgi:hypothetical protein